MTLSITIAAIVTAAVTFKLMYLIFLSGKTITNATLFGRFVSRIDPARRAFVTGWRTQNWRYIFIAYPSMIVTTSLVSTLLYWMMPVLDNSGSFSDKLRYCLMIFGVGVSVSLTVSLILILLVYFVISLVDGWWNTVREEKSDAQEPEAAKEGNAQPATAGEIPGE